MVEPVCIEKIDKNSRQKVCICNQAYIDSIKDYEYTKYETYDNTYISTMEDLISHCFTYNEDVIIPDGYKITKIYSIVCTTADFMPDARNTSNCRAYVIYSSTNKELVQEKFKTICESVKKETRRKNNRHFCWHTEDYADNQIIHSYDLTEGCIIEKR